MKRTERLWSLIPCALLGVLWTSTTDVSRAEDAPAATAARDVDPRTFAGLLYVKQGRVGTRSEGPDYYLQTYRNDYLLEYKKPNLWSKDEALEPFVRKMVGIRGTLTGKSIRVQQIQEIKAIHIPKSPLEMLVEGNGEFAFDLLKKLGTPGDKNAERNLAVSPHSISTALAMTYAGARGETAAEMARTLHFTGVAAPLLHATYGDLQRVLHANPRADFFTIQAANRLWADKEFAPKVLPEFRDVTSRDYGAELATLSFATDADGSRRAINQWVEERTAKKIPELIPSGGVDKLTRLVLTNALHFQGYWLHPFDKYATKPAPFHVAGDQTVDVPTMQQKSVLPYVEEDYAQAVALPVKGEMYSLVLVLPREKQTLADVRNRLSGRSFFQLAKRMTPQQVELHVPRFVAKSSFELGPTLSAMGMSKAFSVKDADFSGINGQKNLFIDKVFHQALVDVNEAGVEAAAATAVVIKLKSLPPKATLVRIDRPFLYALRDNRTGSILFLGQVVNPKQ